ncbi:hypothetical protein ECC30_04785 [Helicobacter pylori]|nr:hypothetical protein ECC28_02415 [Helicobacter pylori]RVY56470.1 hypothetical protein ECC30_04785 [Helicobacter pylori]RVY96652.1 hypothetical protein EC517_04350 [Helicobacter pylori]
MLGLSFLKTTAFLKSLDFKLFGFFVVSLRFCYAKIFEIWRLTELNTTSDILTHFMKACKNFWFYFNGILVIKFKKYL